MCMDHAAGGRRDRSRTECGSTTSTYSCRLVRQSGLRPIDNQIDEALEEFSRRDKYEVSEEKSVLVARTQDALDVLKARKAEYTNLRKQLSDCDDTQISLTDPHTRSLSKHGRESLVGYTVQSVVDDTNKLIIPTQVTNENDLNALGQLVEDTHELLDLEVGERMEGQANMEVNILTMAVYQM